MMTLAEEPRRCEYPGCIGWANPGDRACVFGHSDDPLYNKPGVMLKSFVYGISAGEYSDYRMLAVCPDWETALALYRRVFQYPMNYMSSLRIEPVQCVRILEDVQPVAAYEVAVDDVGVEKLEWRRLFYEYPWEFSGDDSGWITGWGARARSYRGYDVALKVARDRLAEARALKAGA